jgi:hypothetical protein
MTDKALATTPQGGAIAKPTANFSLAKWPEADFNRLVPTDTIMTTDLLMPVVQIVQLDIEDDTYKSNDVPAGHRAPGARALNKFANAASLSFYNERRVDDGTNPDLLRVSIDVSMVLPTGQRITATGTKEVDLRRMTMTPAQLAKFRSFFYEHVATRARSRAIRAILSLKSSYSDAELRKPFAVVTFVPNTSQPDVRKAMLASLSGATSAVFGPAPAALAVGPGVEVRLPEAPPDDDVVDGESREVEAEPEWMVGATAAPTAPSRHKLLALLQDAATGSDLAGDATPEQLTALREALAPFPKADVVAVMGLVFGTKLVEIEVDAGKTRAMLVFTAAQAHAIVTVENSLAVPEFRGLWIELAQIAAAKGGVA